MAGKDCMEGYTVKQIEEPEWLDASQSFLQVEIMFKAIHFLVPG
jgi:hypothetical protein